MSERFRGPAIVGLILGGVLLILGMNLDLKWGSGSKVTTSGATEGSTPKTVESGASAAAAVDHGPIVREYPIGEELERNQMRIAAVWLPSEPMAGMPPHRASADLLHIEADIKAAEGNRNGFAQDEKIPYMIVHYTIRSLEAPKGGQAVAPIAGTMIPMVARDGFHYGSTIEMPGPGRYTLTYQIEPPSAGGMGRHTDVDPWWKPFEVSFDWDYSGQGKP